MLIGVIGIILVVCGLFLYNRWAVPKYGLLAVSDFDNQITSKSELTVLTWNIGFAALGAKADLVIDGGKNLRALPQEEIEKAAKAIAGKLVGFDADIVLLQETANAGFLTRGVDVQNHISERLTGYSQCFWADFQTRFVPAPLKLRHGMASFSRNGLPQSRALDLPQDPFYYYGFLKKYYGAIVQEYPIEGKSGMWVVINIHLSAFDEGANIRKQQMKALFDFSQKEFEAGNYVIIGGDWNMRLSKTKFPHTAKGKAVFEDFDLNQKYVPKGWMICADPETASLRSLSNAYVKGQSYTSIVDGFVISPNVFVKTVETIDLGFEHTDHHPVSARFSTIG